MNDQKELSNIIRRQEKYLEELMLQAKHTRDRLAFYKKEYKEKYSTSHEIKGDIKPGDQIRLKRNTLILGNAERVPVKHDGLWVRVVDINQAGNYDYWIDGRRRSAQRCDISEIREFTKIPSKNCKHPHDALQRIWKWPIRYRCTMCDEVLET